MTNAERALYLVNTAATQLTGDGRSTADLAAAHLSTPANHLISGCYWEEAIGAICEAEEKLREAKEKLKELLPGS